MRSKYARKQYYKVINRSSGQVISRHYKLSNARKALLQPKYRDNNSIRVVDQDGRGIC